MGSLGGGGAGSRAAAGPGTAGPSGGGGRGAQITFERRKTSKQKLDIDWDYPASIKIEAAKDEHTTSQVRMFALPRDEAFERLSAKDRRPLLVVRECGRCKGTDDALLARALDNEKTLLLSKFFHCIKLKQHVLDEDHTFNQLFAGEKPPHLFLATPDGKQMMALPGTQSQKALWDTMFKLLDVEYERDARQAVKDMIKLLSKYDHLDSMEDMYLEKIDTEIEKRGPRSPKLRQIRAKLAKIRGQKDAAKLREAKILDLGLKRADVK